MRYFTICTNLFCNCHNIINRNRKSHPFNAFIRELQRYGVKVSVDEGIYVVKLTSDGAASKAGIQQGDVIVKLDGKDITTYKSFLTALYSHKAGDKVKVVVNRSGTEKTIEVTLQEK